MPITPPDPLSLRFTGAQVLTETRLTDTDLAISDGTIGGTGRAIDATGYLILPGIIDLHGDGFERHLAPRRGALRDLAQGLPAVEAELAANGITTAYLAQFLSWEGGMRGPDFAERLTEALASYTAQIDLRLQLRLEVGFPQAFDTARKLAAHSDYLVFNDHLPHKALAKGKRPPRLQGQALKAGRSPEAHEALLRDLHARFPAAQTALIDLAADLRVRGLRLGSHDDATPEVRAHYRALGADIAEFPETPTAAQAAKAAGDPVIMGAPNVVRGGSHDGKVAAADLIRDGLVDALVSDYHYPAPAQAALRLWREGTPLKTAWHLISAGPAATMGLTDRGHIAQGLRADLTFMNAETHRIESTFCGGHIAHLTGVFAHRMIP